MGEMATPVSQVRGRQRVQQPPSVHALAWSSPALPLLTLVTRPSVSPDTCVLGVNLLLQCHPSMVSQDRLALQPPPAAPAFLPKNNSPGPVGAHTCAVHP